MKITVNESPVGVGKTFGAIARMIKFPGRYILAVERKEAIYEICSRIMAASTKSSAVPNVVLIHSENGRVGSVTRQIADLTTSIPPDAHTVVLITHEAMMMTDFSGFQGWSLFVDEVPSFFTMHSYQTPTDVEFFQTHYTLTPVDEAGRWHLVGLTAAGKALAPSAIADCDSHSFLHHFHRRASDPRMGPVVDLKAWEEMATGERWVWWSLFHVEQIEAFSHVEFLGNGFTQSISFSLFDDPSIEWDIINTKGTRPLSHRNAHVNYYSDRPTSLFYLCSPQGQADVGKIASFIASTTKQPLLWSCNERFQKAMEAHLDAREYRLPRQAGTSALMHYHHAAMIYATKPSHEVGSAISGLGCTSEQWVISNEYEIILQFLTRTSVRDVNSTTDVTLHVFNREQADYLIRFFDNQPHITATVEKVDLELSSQTKPTRGAGRATVTEEEREARKFAHRERCKIAQRERRAKAKAA